MWVFTGIFIISVGAIFLLDIGLFKMFKWLGAKKFSNKLNDHVFAGPYRTTEGPERQLSLIEILKAADWRWDGDRLAPWFFLGQKFKLTCNNLYIRNWFFFKEVPISTAEFYDLRDHLRRKLERLTFVKEVQQRKKARKIIEKANRVARSL